MCIIYYINVYNFYIFANNIFSRLKFFLKDFQRYKPPTFKLIFYIQSFHITCVIITGNNSQKYTYKKLYFA